MLRVVADVIAEFGEPKESTEQLLASGRPVGLTVATGAE
jgi:hypothetical protein